MLEAGGDEYAFQFIRNKISDIAITPAQLALDPCSASAVITDVNTGEVRALVTYRATTTTSSRNRGCGVLQQVK